MPGFAAFHRSLTEPRDSSTCSLTAFKLGQHTDEDFYTWLETHPTNQAAFHRFMEAQFATLPTWLDVFDFKAELGHNAGPADPVLVDVGGGNGSQCAGLRKAWPDMPGKMILQDKPQVLEKALEVEGLEKMGHDFLTEQPVKGQFSPMPCSSQRRTALDTHTAADLSARRTCLLLPPNHAQLRR